MAATAQDVQQQVGQDAGSKELRVRLEAIVARLEKEAEERVSKRTFIEERWLTDLRQLHGQYDDAILKALKGAKKSTLFINQTRAKTNAMEARLSDMLFPTDDRNWGIEPTPVPELTLEAEEAVREAAAVNKQAAESPEDEMVNARAKQAQERSAAVQLRLEEARKRSRAMQEEIADHLKQCRYEIQAREIIRDACRIGTGVMKGPVTGGHTRRTWQQADSGFELRGREEQRPVYWRVDPWNFFPDMDARTIEESEGDFERHLMNAKMLRKLSRQPGFDADAIRRLLRDQPRASTPQYIADLRAITGTYHDALTDRYHVWEYHGPLSAEEMRDLAIALGKEEVVEDLDLEDVDPLAELQVVLWCCQGEVLKFGIHHLDSGEPIYSVFCLEKDEASIFGFGLPYIMRDSQKALNAGWRTMMDNAGLASGPQIEIDPEVIEPANGEWVLEPRKIWLRKQGAASNKDAFKTHDIEMHQAEIVNIIELARRNLDEETGVSVLAQGEQGAHTTKTAQGMSLLMNATSVVFRRIVKNFDDDMTTPNIRRLYDWLMQFSQKEHIKGDFETDARGTSVLLVREMQSANLLVFLAQFSGHPLLGRFLKQDGLPAMRRLVQTMMIPSDEVVKSDTEVRQEEAASAGQPPPPNPEMEKIAAQLNMTQIKVESARELEMLRRETALIQFAAQANLKLEELRGLLADKQRDRQSKERIFAAEVAVEERMAARGNARGSGGYVSAGGGANG